MEDKLNRKVTDTINQILEEEINGTNIDPLYKLVKIKHITKEDENMNYGNYYGDRYPMYGHDDYYGRRERDSRGRYRGHEHLDRMYDDYSRYEEGKHRYGSSEDTKRSLKYMLESMEHFARMLKDEASSQEEVEMIRQSGQRIAQL